MNKVWNVLGCIAATLVSIVLVALILVVPVYGSVAGFTKPEVITETVVETVQNLDLEEMMPSAEDVQEILPVDGITVDTIKDLMETEAVADAISLYAEDVLASLLDGSEERAFTAEALKAIADEQIDNLVAAVKPYLPEESAVNDEQIAAEIKSAVDTHAEILVEALPVPAPTETDDGGILDLIRDVVSPTFLIGLIAAIAVCALIIYACRFKRFGGLLWLGVDALIAAVPVTLLAILFGGSFIVDVAATVAPSVGTLLRPATAIISRNFTVTAVICAMAGVILIVTYILLRRYTLRKTAASSEAAPLPEVAPAD